MGSSNGSIRSMHLTLAGVDGEAIGTCQYYDLIPYVSDFPSGATYHVDYYPTMGSLMTEFVKLALQYRIYKTAEADTGGEKENDLSSHNRSFSIKGYPETYSIKGLPDLWVANTARQEEPRRKICLVSYDYGAEVANSDYYDDDSEEESQESDENFAIVEWTPDCNDGFDDDSFGLFKFKHRGSGSTFEGVPRGQLVREGKCTGFVVITEVAEKRRTLAIRDHDLLQEYAPNCARPHPSPPKIVPLVGHQLDAIFELAYSRGGEIEAFPMKYED
ncbi:hypothetical protein KC316_g3913 [Hortaea werneckii]|nr:hypothetical protein KC324_g2561 [Hortaea werneckii]KAI7589510.1 hypothetical protein KC316_g3913 [Hortaea werneckii]